MNPYSVTFYSVTIISSSSKWMGNYNIEKSLKCINPTN